MSTNPDTIDRLPELDAPEHPASRAEALLAAQRCIVLLKERFGATRVIPFGSVVGQAPWHAGSDLDLAAEGIAPDKFFRARAALDELAPRGLQVDLVPLESVYPELRARILGEVEMPDEPVLALKGLVNDELKSLERVAQEMKLVHAAAADPPGLTDILAMGALVQQFYNGIENIFKRIAVLFDDGVPKTAHWHKDLLNQMNRAHQGRPAVVDNRLRAWLEDDLDFRHFFSHAYGFQLEWNRLYPHVARMEDTLALLRTQLEQFFAAVRPDDTSKEGQS